MSSISEKYKKARSTKIRINHKNILQDSYKENEIDLKIKKIINILYADLFQDILIFSRTQFINGVEKKLDKIISEHYPEYIIIKKSYIDNIKKEFNSRYNYEYRLLKKALDNFIKNPKTSQFITNFTPHCQKCEKIAYHNCNNSLLHGKFIQINIINNNFVLCTQCHVCYKSELIEMYCKSCKTNYYSSLIQDNNLNTINRFRFHKKLPFATWEKYHCGFIINEIMKCIKCKSNFFYDSVNNKLICLNPKCKFEAKPKSIIWKCSICNSEFVSAVTAFNPLEIKIYKNAIDYALTIREKARPCKIKYCNFCGRDISKATFYHKRDCDGELLMSKLNNKEVVVCSKCHGMNFYSQYSWICPLCDRKIKNKNIHNLMKSIENNTKNDSISKIHQRKGYSYDKNQNIKNLQLSKNKNIFTNEIPSLNKISSEYIKPIEENYKKNNLDKSKSNASKDISKESRNLSRSKKSSYFSFKNLFLRNDSEENYKKTTAFNVKQNNILKNGKTPKNSNSIGKPFRKKTTLFDILQKRHKEKSLSNIKDHQKSINEQKEKSLKNNSIENKSINNSNNNNSIKNNRNKIHLFNNKRNEAPAKYTIREKYIRSNIKNNINVYRSQKKSSLNESENISKNEKVPIKIYNKNTAKNYRFKREYDKENKIESIDNDNNNNKEMFYMKNHMTQFSLYNREKEQLLENKMKVKEEFEKMKTDNKTPKRINLRSKILENSKNNNKENDESQKENNKKVDFMGSFRNSYNRIAKTKSIVIKTDANQNDDNSKKFFKKNTEVRRFNKKVEYNCSSPETKKKETMAKLQNDIKPVENSVQDAQDNNNNIFKFNTPDNYERSRQSKNRKQNKSLFHISLDKNIDSIERQTPKTISRRRYYQSLTKSSKEKKIINENNNSNSNLINDTNSPIIINYSKSNDLFAKKMKEFNFNINTITNSNTNILKDNNENENDSQTNIDIVDFDINEEKMNLVSDSKRNSIFINGLLEHNDLLYSSINIDELIQNCNLPKFNETDFIFENSIGEGSFGTIFEVEEIKTGNKYAN